MHLKNDFAQLDGLRAIAALSVFANHLFQQFRSPAASHWVGELFAYLGAWGVAVFFALSGFCIHCSTILQLEKSRTFDVQKYLQRRFLRIYPAFVVCLVGCFALERLRSSNLLPISPPESVVAHLFLLSGFIPSLRIGVNNVLWSVVLEMHFYLLYGALWRHFSGIASAARTTLWAAALAVVTYAISVTLLPAGSARVTLQHTFFATFWTWCLGALVAEVSNSGRIPERAYGAGAALACAWLASLGIAFAPPTVSLQLQRFVLPILIAVGLYWLLHVRTPALPWKILKPIGRISYSLYLFHPVAIWLVLGIPLPSWGRIVLAVLAGLALSAMGYRYIEAPFMRLRSGPRITQPSH